MQIKLNHRKMSFTKISAVVDLLITWDVDSLDFLFMSASELTFVGTFSLLFFNVRSSSSVYFFYWAALRGWTHKPRDESAPTPPSQILTSPSSSSSSSPMPSSMHRLWCAPFIFSAPRGKRVSGQESSEWTTCGCNVCLFLSLLGARRCFKRDGFISEFLYQNVNRLFFLVPAFKFL